MVNIGRLTIKEEKSIVVEGEKLSLFLNELKIKKEKIDELENAFSVTCENALKYEEKIQIKISLDTKNKEVFFVTRKNTSILELEKLEQLFDKVFLIDSMYYFATTYKDSNVIVDENFINKSKKIFSIPTHEDLLNELNLSKAELEKSNIFADAVLENASEAVCAKDLQCRYTYVNSSWRKFFLKRGYRDISVIGKTASEIFSQRDFAFAQKSHKEDLEVLKTNKNVEYENSLISDTGMQHLYVRKIPMIVNGEKIGVCSIISDITDQKNIEKVLKEAKDAAEDIAKVKSEFLANMSHEIRTPLNAIIGMSYLLDKTDLTQKQKDYVNKINSSSHHLLNIINDILDFSKIESGMLNIDETSFKLSDVLSNISNMVSDTCISKGLELLFEIDSDITLNSNYLGDPLRLGQILINYVTNAVKFTEKGEIIVKVSKCHCNEDECTIKFEVKDTGIGMTKEQVNELFKPFKQADASITRKYGGTGLGLSISANLAKLMGGEVGVTSEYGKGSNFWFTTKIKIDKNKKEEIDLKDLKDKRVLVVDDNSKARMVLNYMIKDVVKEVFEANSGESAIKYLLDEQKNDRYIDIMYIDMQMKGITGVETIKKIEKLNLKKKPICVIVTSYSREAIYKGINSADVDIIVKPITVGVAIESLLKNFSKNIVTISKKKEEEINLTTIEGSKILLVEDNDFNQEVAKEILFDKNINVEIANNGQEAINMFKENYYDLILMDIQMPILDGYEATKEIRKTEKGKNIPIVAMTANAMSIDIQKCLDVGMDNHVAKPIDTNQLFSVLKKYIKPKENNTYILNKQDEEVTVNNINYNEYFEIIKNLDFIDEKIADKRSLGKPKFYVNIVKKFVQNNENFIKEIKQSLEIEDYKKIERYAHTLKGVSATVGIYNLPKLCEILEKEAELNKNKEKINILIQQIEKLLNTILIKLKNVLPKEKETIVNEGVYNKEKFIKYMEQLKEAVITRKPKKCKEVIEMHKDVVWENSLKDKSIELNEFIKKYKFDKAIELIDEVFERSNYEKS